MLNNNNYLRHYGILGMKWGKHKSTTSKPKKGKLHVDSKRLIDGKNLAEELLSSLGGVVASKLVGGFLVSKGSEFAGNLISTYGSLYSIGNGIGSVLNRVERRP
jgi:hypothetical protein